MASPNKLHSNTDFCEIPFSRVDGVGKDRRAKKGQVDRLVDRLVDGQNSRNQLSNAYYGTNS